MLWKHRNPFEVIVDDLTVDPRLVTLQYLDWVALTLSRAGFHCETYGETLDVLEFLHARGVLKLETNEQQEYVISLVS